MPAEKCQLSMRDCFSLRLFLGRGTGIPIPETSVAFISYISPRYALSFRPLIDLEVARYPRCLDPSSPMAQVEEKEFLC
jgi:hypothetical protein